MYELCENYFCDPLDIMYGSVLNRLDAKSPNSRTFRRWYERHTNVYIRTTFVQEAHTSNL